VIDDTAATEAGIEFQRALGRFRASCYVPRYAPDDLTTSEMHVVMAVGHACDCGDVPRPRDIGHALHLSPSALSQTLGSLEKKGYIVRERHASDGRSVAVLLTETGRSVVDEGVCAYRESMRELRAYLGDDDLREFARLLNKVNAFFQEQVDAGKMMPHPHRPSRDMGASAEGKEAARALV